RRWNRPPPGAEQAEHIMQAARLALIVVIVVAGFSGLFMVQHMAGRDAHSELRLRRQERISYVRLLIEEAVASGERYAQQPELTALLLQQPRAKPVLPPHDFSSVTLERGDRVVAHIGNEIRRPQVQVPLPLGGTVALLWDGAFYLRQRLPVVQGSHTLGAVELEQPLALLGSIGIESASFGSSGEIGLCGRAPAGAAVVCFPQRLHPEPYVLRTGFRDVADPMALALAGKSGVADTIDYRGQRVLAAYAPIAGMGLGLVVKMDSQELYAPIRLEVAILGPLLIALAIVGLELLRWQVRPLIAELVASRNQVASSEARFRAAAESGMDPFYIFESVRSRLTGGIASFRLIYANQPGETFADLAAGGSEILNLSSVPQLAAAGDVLGQLRNVVVQRRYWVEEFTPGRGGDGAPQWLHLQAVPLGDGVAVTLRDISQRKREEDRLRAMAQTDALTGLANHSAFQKKLAQAMQNSQRHQRQRLLAVLYLDIDHFKQINDSHGHGVGDRVLQAFAARLLRAVRSADMVARPGGDEFAILLENLDSPRDAERVVASILAAMEDPMHIDDHLLPIHTSIGVAYYRGEALSGEGLQQRADAALYAAKRGGRNAWRVHSD
ncbi:MAG: diguanylate cyclase domain-containing protein, partial [Terriglobales bacterium]